MSEKLLINKEINELEEQLIILKNKLKEIELKETQIFNYIEPTAYNLFLYADRYSVENNSKNDFDIGVQNKMVGDGNIRRKINSASFCRFKENNISKISFVGYIENINELQPWEDKGGKKWKNYNIYNRGNMTKVRSVKEFCETYKVSEKEISGYNLCGIIGNKHKNIFHKSILDGYWKNE